MKRIGTQNRLMGCEAVSGEKRRIRVHMGPSREVAGDIGVMENKQTIWDKLKKWFKHDT